MKLTFIGLDPRRTNTYVITVKHRFSFIKRRIFYRAITPKHSLGVELDRLGRIRAVIFKENRWL